MKSNITKQNLYNKVAKQVKEIKGFYTHFLIYCLIIPVIIFVNLKFVPEFHWFWFSLLGWGFGLTMHWFGVFGFKLIGLGKDWEERKIKEYLNDKN